MRLTAIIIPTEGQAWIVALADNPEDEARALESKIVKAALTAGARIANDVQVEAGKHEGERLGDIYRRRNPGPWLKWVVAERSDDIPPSLIGEDVISAARAFLIAIDGTDEPPVD